MLCRITALVLAALAAAAHPVSAQSPALPSVAIQPLVVMLPNYNSIPVGEIGSLEGGAYSARVRDSSATWYNPAGLARASVSSISGSAGAFQIVSLTPERLNGTGGSFQQLPAAVGLMVNKPFGLERWTLGAQLTASGNWSVGSDVELSVTKPASLERFTYASSGAFGGWLGSVAVGYEATPSLKLGASLDAQLTRWTADVVLSDQYVTATDVDALVIEGRGSASALAGRATVGAQYALSDAFHVAAVVRSPGVSLTSSGSRYQEGVATAGTQVTTASLFEPEGDVEYRVPLEVRAGAAFVAARAQFEIDVIAYSGGGLYEAFRAPSPLIVRSDPGAGGTPIETSYEIPPAIIDSRRVFNVAVGGHVWVTESGSWKIHGGFSTDGSPVGPSDTVFLKVPMRTWTIGVSGTTRVVLGSIGLRYETGLSEPLTIRRLQNGDEVTTKLRVRNTGIVYSFTLKF